MQYKSLPISSRTLSDSEESEELRVKTGLVWKLFLALSALFLAWPKYLSVDFGFTRMNPANMFILVLGFSLIFIWPLRAMQGEKIALSGKIILGLFAIEWLARFYSNFHSPDMLSSTYATLRSLLWTVSPFIIALRFAGGKEGIVGFIKVAIASCALLAAVGIAERLGGISAPSWIFSHLPVNLPEEYASMLLRDKTRDGAFRIQSLMSHPLVAGEVFSALMPVCIAGFVFFRGRWRFVSLLALFLAVIALFYTGSRSSLVAAAVGVGLLIFFGVIRSGSIRVRVFGTSTLALALLFGTPLAIATVAELRSGQTSAQIESSYWREEMWRLGAPAIEQKPLFGHGDGQAVQIAGIRNGKGSTIDDHYLSTLIDFGYINLSIFILFNAAIVATALFSPGARSYSVLFYALAAGIVAILVNQKATSIFEGMGVLYLFAGVVSSLSIRPAAPAVRRGTVA